MRKDIERLNDILEAIEAIEKYTSTGRDLFDKDELVRTWCLHHIEIIGEAVSRLSEDIKRKYPVAPWRNITAMRNSLIHGYFDVDWEIVWGVVSKELGPFRKSIVDILTFEGWI